MRIAIIGAGPAGCHFAWRLSGTEHEILLLDPKVPYEKPCGGCLGPLVSQLFPDLMALSFPRHYPTRLLLTNPDFDRVERVIERCIWAVVSRADFGKALLERALANQRVRFIPARVVDVEETKGRWSIHTAAGQTFFADFVVGADGVRSIVRRRVVGSIPNKHLAITLGYLVRGGPDILAFQTFPDLDGFLWSCPGPDHTSIGIGCRLNTVPPRDLWQRIEQFLQEFCPEATREKRRMALIPIARDASLWDNRCLGQGWALLGDAAGHVHPITGEGIAFALWSAELLAQAFVEGSPLSFEDLWRSHYGWVFARACMTSEYSAQARIEATQGLFREGLMSALEGISL